MKKRLLVTTMFLAGCLSVHAQLTLNAGESYTYQFSGLPFISRTVPGAPINSGFGFAIFNSATFGTGDSVTVELFESNPNGSPFATRSSDVLFNTQYGAGVIATGFGWNDLQGAVRITQLTGSATLERIVLQYYQAVETIGTVADLYGDTVVPVPEPDTIAFLALGVLVGGLYYRSTLARHGKWRVHCSNRDCAM